MTKEQWQEIKNKQPKAFSLFREYTITLGFVEIERDSLFIVYPFLLFSLFKKFFDSVGIIISIIPEPKKYNDVPLSFDLYFRWLIWNKKNDKYYENKENKYDTHKAIYISREEAQDSATIKAFEILNTMIEKGEINEGTK